LGDLESEVKEARLRRELERLTKGGDGDDQFSQMLRLMQMKLLSEMSETRVARQDPALDVLRDEVRRMRDELKEARFSNDGGWSLLKVWLQGRQDAKEELQEAYAGRTESEKTELLRMQGRSMENSFKFLTDSVNRASERFKMWGDEVRPLLRERAERNLKADERRRYVEEHGHPPDPQQFTEEEMAAIAARLPPEEGPEQEGPRFEVIGGETKKEATTG